MTNQEILTTAVQRAIDNGWELPDAGWDYEVQSDRVIILTSMALGDDGYEEPGTWRVSTFEIIFDQGFAKALWGDGKPHNPGQCYRLETCWHETDNVSVYDGYDVKRWQYHLQMMVIADDPIKYLGEHLGG